MFYILVSEYVFNELSVSLLFIIHVNLAGMQFFQLQYSIWYKFLTKLRVYDYDIYYII